LGIPAQVRGKSLTGLIKICDALFRPAFAIKKALQLTGTKNLHFAKAPFPGFSAEEVNGYQ